MIRPEFILKYPKPLNSDSFTMNNNDDSEQDDVEVAKANKYMQELLLPAFLKNLEVLNEIAFDSHSLTQIFHQEGINMRYLGWVAKNSNYPHVSNICKIELAARACKKILRHHMSDYLLNLKEKYQDNKIIYQTKLKKEMENQNINILTRVNNKNQQASEVNEEHAYMVQLQKNELIEIVIDFFNLVFGQGEETEFFWQNILQKQILKDFNINIEKQDIYLGGLFNAMQYHSSVKIKFDHNNCQLGLQNSPFKQQDFIQFQSKVKSFELQSLDILKIAEKYKQYFTDRNFKLALKSINIKQNLIKHMNIATQNPNLLEDVINNSNSKMVQLDHIEILLENKEIDEAYKKAKQIIKTNSTLDPQDIRAYLLLIKINMMLNKESEALLSLENLLRIIDFNLGSSHPFHIQAYSLLADQYLQQDRYEDSMLLYKNALQLCLSSLDRRR